ncbi:PDR/VanB family oxidoreductase [Castellaniella hirudinis]|uniref:PDR/VanB family oxidoreductase n=1 Tax=Castellaniella hirudinis TaxID=1144617 RepID=UPI0039C45068
MELVNVEIAAKKQLVAGVYLFCLKRMDGRPLPPFTAGAHIGVHLPNGMIRQYSLCGSPQDRMQYQIAVRVEPDSRGGSVLLCNRLKPGDTLAIEYPVNRFALQHAGKTLLLAGGIGIAPMLPMAAQLFRGGQTFALHYYNQARSRAAFIPEIQAAPWKDAATLYFSDESGRSRQRIGDLLRTVDRLAHVYACGPSGFVQHVIQNAIQAGLSSRQLHYEAFALPDDLKPSCAGPAFKIKIKSTGRVYDIPADEPPTRALARQGVKIPVSCEEGNCGTCLTRVLEGVPDHRDVYLSDADHARHRIFTPCCSRSKSAVLLLDI